MTKTTQCRFRKDGECGKCANGTKGAKKNQWVGYCVAFIGEDDCKAC